MVTKTLRKLKCIEGLNLKLSSQAEGWMRWKLIPNPKCYVTKEQTTNHWQLLLKPLLRRIIRCAFLYQCLCHSHFLPLVPLITTNLPFLLFFGFCNMPPTHKSKPHPIKTTKTNQFPWIQPHHTFFYLCVALFNSAWLSSHTFLRMRHKSYHKKIQTHSSKDTLLSED